LSLSPVCSGLIEHFRKFDGIYSRFLPIGMLNAILSIGAHESVIPARRAMNLSRQEWFAAGRNVKLTCSIAASA
jgi:hypothetical protein